jgi:hypothetical protein
MSLAGRPVCLLAILRRTGALRQPAPRPVAHLVGTESRVSAKIQYLSLQCRGGGRWVAGGYRAANSAIEGQLESN